MCVSNQKNTNGHVVWPLSQSGTYRFVSAWVLFQPSDKFHRSACEPLMRLALCCVLTFTYLHDAFCAGFLPILSLAPGRENKIPHQRGAALPTVCFWYSHSGIFSAGCDVKDAAAVLDLPVYVGRVHDPIIRFHLTPEKKPASSSPAPRDSDFLRPSTEGRTRLRYPHLPSVTSLLLTDEAYRSSTGSPSVSRLLLL